MSVMDMPHANPAPSGRPELAESKDTQPDDPIPDATAWRRYADPKLDTHDISRLQEAARQSGERITQRLTSAGLVPSGSSGVPDLDARRDVDAALDIDADTLERIDELHDRRRSASPRERQRATTVLAEALHRIVDGYAVGRPPDNRLVRAMRRVEVATARVYARLTVFQEWSPRADWWESRGRWLLFALATAGALLVALGHVGAAAAIVISRTLIAATTAEPQKPPSTWRQFVGVNPDLGSSVCRYAGDALLLGGMAIGLQLHDRPVWAAVTVGAALLGLLATTSRLVASCQGLRMPQLWIERATKDLAFSGALLAAVLVGRGGIDGVVPVQALAAVAVGASGVGELIRDAYYGRRRRQLLTSASVADRSVPNAIVVTTSDAIVVNLCRQGPRAPIFPDRGVDGGPHLHIVRASGD
jgi:hypothetical protein